MSTVLATRKAFMERRKKHLMWWLNKPHKKGCQSEGKADQCM